MKKILIALMGLMVIYSTASASNNTIFGASISTSSAKATATANGFSVSESTTVKGIKLNGGVQYDKARIQGYALIEQYSDIVVVSGEGDAISIGVMADYTSQLQDNVGAYVGASLGYGEKDLGSNGSLLLGSSEHSFIDVGFRTGLIVSFDQILIDAGIEYKNRYFEDLSHAGNTLKDMNENMIGFVIGVNYHF